jgi:hypothetical protein
VKAGDMPTWDEAQWLAENDTADHVPDWVRERQVKATRLLGFAPVTRTRAEPLDHAQIRNALEGHFGVVETRELEGLDVWFVGTVSLTTGLMYDIILYEHMGDWHCLSVQERKG